MLCCLLVALSLLLSYHNKSIFIHYYHNTIQSLSLPLTLSLQMWEGTRIIIHFLCWNLWLTSTTYAFSTTLNYIRPLRKDEGAHGNILHVFPLRKTTNKSKSTTAKLIELKATKESTQKSAAADSEMYEVVLNELESEKLYGNSPRLCELDNLANWLRRGKLNIAPKYQRGYVWKADRASRLVVTVLCNRIVPAIVLHERSKGIYDVVGKKILDFFSFHF